MPVKPIIKIAVLFLVIITCEASLQPLRAQACCSGGGGSPIAGGVSLGVLREKQFEAASNFQIFNSDRFLAGVKDTAAMFKKFYSNYLYNRISYGVTSDLTISIEAGYFFNKTQSGFSNHETQKSKGIADLIIFPRYNIFSRNRLGNHSEASVGLGYKIPLGKYNDSAVVYENPITGNKVYAISPPLIQPTNGSHDFVFYGFVLQSIRHNTIRLFANGIYIKKGWNALGQKFGDFAGINIFASRTVASNLTLTLQGSAQWTDKVRGAKGMDLLALYNIDVESTGFKKVAVTPQISYAYKGLVGFFMGEIPVYQKVNGIQLASKYIFTLGLSYRFFTSNDAKCANDKEYEYQCSMKCKGGGSDQPGNCKVCGMALEKVSK